ncbi:MAG: hypothetical protein RIB69_14895 [Roseovarius sp.]
MTEEEKLKFAIAAAKAKKKQDVDGIRARAEARKTATERKANAEAGQSKGGLDAQDKFFEQFVPEMTDEELLERQLLARQKLARQNVAQAPKDWKTTLWENIIGDNDPTTQNTGEKIGSFLNKAGESMTLGLVGDEASAAVESLAPGVDYEARRDHYRQQERQFSEDHPIASIGAEFAPLAIPGLGVANAATRGVGLGRAAVQGAGLAGAQGATYGFMEGEEGFRNRLNEAGEAGALSAGLGAATTPVVRGAQRIADHRATKKAVREMVKTAPSVDDLTSQATAFYGRGEARGQVLTPGAARGLADDALATLREKGVMRSNGQLITRDPDVRRVVEELQDLAEHGLEGNQVKPVRALFQSAAGDRDPMRARIGTILLDKFDDAIKRNAPEFAEGDALYHRAKKAEAVDQMIDLADTSDTANALRREFQKADRRNIKGQAGSMTPDEVTAMQNAARAGRVSGAVGRSAPRSISGALFSGSTPLIAGSLAGSPSIGAAVGATALGAGMVGRGLSNRAQRKSAEIAKALIASGGQMPKATAPEALREALARYLVGASSRSGAGYMEGP